MFLKNSLKFLVLCLMLVPVIPALAQDDDLMKLLKNQDTLIPKNEPVAQPFKGTYVINSHSTKTLGKNNLDFRITHRFGNIGAQSGGGVHNFYGFDNASNIRFAFDYGILDNLMIGVGRSKVKEHIDGLVKYRFLTQTTNNKIPLSVAVMGNTAVTPMKDVNNNYTKFLRRVSYTGQLIISRKFGNIGALEILPTYVHRNYVQGAINPDNGAAETNGFAALGIAGRVRITSSTSFIFDYYYTFSKFRQNNPQIPYYMPLAVGIEIETGGHVFHINFTNSSGIIEQDFLESSPDDWLKGGFKFGFNISRVFVLGGKEKWKHEEPKE